MSIPNSSLALRFPGSAGRPLTGWMVLAILLGFFGTVASVNATMIYYALSTFRGEVDASPYEHGLAYDRDIAEAKAQDDRHWQVSGTIDRPEPGAPPHVEFSIRDVSGHPIGGLDVTARLQFATDKALDRSIALAETRAGLYAADTAVPPGRYELIVEAKSGGARVFRSQSRILLP